MRDTVQFYLTVGIFVMSLIAVVQRLVMWWEQKKARKQKGG